MLLFNQASGKNVSFECKGFTAPFIFKIWCHICVNKRR
nr:MAG TPA: hypothetical protein [Caudoviricetes sp.]